MNSELAYAFLMGMGWFFLIGWLVALAVAYAKAFQGDQPVHWAVVPDRTVKPSRSKLSTGMAAKS